MTDSSHADASTSGTTDSPTKLDSSEIPALPTNAPRPPNTKRSLSLSQMPAVTSSATDLTPIRAHYLKKALVSLQFERELKALSNPDSNSRVSILSYLGLPFTQPPEDVAEVHDLLFFRFIFRQFVLTFPFLSAAPKNFFPLKVQPFFDSLIHRNLTGGYNATLNSTEEDVEELGRQKFLHKLEKQLTLVLGNSIKLAEKEDVVRLNQHDLDRLAAIAKRRKERLGKGQKEVFEINVVGVRSVTEKKRLRNRAHDEFIVRTRIPNAPDVCVARRFGDFKTLWDEVSLIQRTCCKLLSKICLPALTQLRKMFPDEPIPLPPSKDRSSSIGSSSTGITSYFTGHSSTEPDAEDQPAAPGVQRTDSMLSTASVSQYKLAREKNRLSLRAYLNAILTNPVLASSPVLRSFLTQDTITLSPQELEDARRREEADNVREEGKRQFDRAVKDRVQKLRDAMAQIKKDLMGKGMLRRTCASSAQLTHFFMCIDGLSHVFSVIRATPNVTDLPPEYKAVLEWGRVRCVIH